MYKASLLVLTLAVFASASITVLPYVDNASQFGLGFLTGSGLYYLNNVQGCISAVDKAASIIVPLMEQVNVKDFPNATIGTADQLEIEGSLAAVYGECKEAITGTYAAVFAAREKTNENTAAYMYNYLSNYDMFVAAGASLGVAMSEQKYFEAGQIYGQIFQNATGFNTTQIDEIISSGEAQYDTMVEGSGNVTGIPVFLQNATLFMEGFGSGFDLSDDTNDIYVAEADIYTIYLDFVTLYNNLTHHDIVDLLKDVNQIWVDFTTAFTDISSGVTNLMQVFNPAIQEAKTNSTALENTFKSNLAAHPLQSAVLAAKFKLDWSGDDWFAAGDAWAQLCAIGLKGLYNTTSTA